MALSDERIASESCSSRVAGKAFQLFPAWAAMAIEDMKCRIRQWLFALPKRRLGAANVADERRDARD